MTEWWKDVLRKVEDVSQMWEEVREEYLIFAPHFHILGISETVEKSATPRIEEKTGVVVHRIDLIRGRLDDAHALSQLHDGVSRGERPMSVKHHHREVRASVAGPRPGRCTACGTMLPTDTTRGATIECPHCRRVTTRGDGSGNENEGDR